MSVNLDVPSIAAADTLGLFRDYDTQLGHSSGGEGWARAVVSKIESELSSPSPVRSSDFAPRDNFSSEEWAVWEWYQKQTEPDRWKGLVDEYKATGSVEVIKPPDEFDTAKATITKPNTDVEDPNVKPFAGSNGGPGSVAVSTDAIVHFANALNIVAPLDGRGGMLFRVIEGLEQIDPRPGAFAIAEVLRKDIMGTSGSTGLRGETAKVLVDIQAVLAAVQTDVRTLAKEYDSTEELNGLAVDKLGDVMLGSDSRIDRLGAQSTKDKDLTGD